MKQRYLSLVTRELVFGITLQVRSKSGCASAEAGKKPEILVYEFRYCENLSLVFSS